MEVSEMAKTLQEENDAMEALVLNLTRIIEIFKVRLSISLCQVVVVIA